MRCRRLGPNDDYSFGRGQQDFWVDSPEAVAQSVKTRLKLWQSEWFLDTEEGTPWHGGVLGNNTAETYGPALRARILATSGVKSIAKFDDTFDREARSITLRVTLDTVYGQAELASTLAVDVGA